ncbi:hypothetical protein [Stenotrophomonas sp. TWI587]|uniref:hypothetical protein n=1 Tax=Stenotrophomonas sp. TWI587 TaxID=3136783 RepID=UPI00320B3E4F
MESIDASRGPALMQAPAVHADWAFTEEITPLNANSITNNAVFAMKLNRLNASFTAETLSIGHPLRPGRSSLSPAGGYRP